MPSQLPTITVELIHGASLDYYDAVNERLGFPGDFPVGLIAHLAGVSANALAVVMIWRSERDALRHIGGDRLDAIDGVRAEIGQTFQATRTITTVETVFVDDQLAAYASSAPVDDRILSAFVMTGPAHHSVNYYSVLRAIDFPANWPDSMLIHAAGGNETHWTVLDAWESSPVMHEYYERVNAELDGQFDTTASGVVIETVGFRLHTLFVDENAPELKNWAPRATGG